MPNHLIHPDLVGAYVYTILVDDVVRYVGKGRRYRVLQHLRIARSINRRRRQGEKVRAYPFHNKLAKAMRAGSDVSYRVVASRLTDDAAYVAEIDEMARYPREQLWNLKSGGVGGDSKMMKEFWADPTYREDILARARRGRANPKFIEQQRHIAEENWRNPEWRARWLKSHRGVWDDPSAAEERRQLLRRVWANPELREKKRALVRSQWTAERKAAMAENRRKAWADPEFKARASASIRAAKQKCHSILDR